MSPFLRRAPLIFLPLALLLFPGAAEGQQLLCAWNTKKDDDDSHTPALDLFRGTYSFSSVETDNGECSSGGCRQLLFGLKSINIPRWVGYDESLFFNSGWEATKLGNQYRNRRDGTFRAHWDDLDLPIPSGSGDLDDDVTHTWCTNPDPGHFIFRGAISRDLRWSPAGFWDAMGDIFGLGENHEYTGPGRRNSKEHSHTLPDERFEGMGFPVQMWRVRDENQAASDQQRFLEEANPRFAVNFTTYEMVLWGEVRRYTTRIQVCDGVLGTGFWESCEWVDVSAYTRTLGGELRVVSYLDHRIGVDGVNPMRMAAQLRVRLRGSSLVPRTVKQSEDYEKEIEELCGNKDGCGRIPHTPAAGTSQDAGFGMTMGSTDTEDQIGTLCRTVFEKHIDSWFPEGGVEPPEECDSEASPLTPDMEPTARELADAVSGEGNTGTPVSEAQKRQENTGVRVIEGDTLFVSSQVQRYCLRTSQRDSVGIVSAPLPVGAERPPPVPAPVLFNLCATRIGTAINEDYPIPVIDSDGCFPYEGYLYCGFR